MNTLQLVEEMGKLEAGLRKFAHKLTRDLAEAAELYQETVYRAVKNIHQYQESSNLRGWLMTIMRNTFINNYRKKRTQQTYQDWSAGNYLMDSGMNSELNAGAANVDYEELLGVVNRLEEALKVPFLLHHQGYKYDEIAARLDIPIGTVKSRIYGARKQLRTMIERQYLIPELIAA